VNEYHSFATMRHGALRWRASGLSGYWPKPALVSGPRSPKIDIPIGAVLVLVE
jgi:hypothetical protein